MNWKNQQNTVLPATEQSVWCVSYTHLDVYKRQVLFFLLMTAATALLVLGANLWAQTQAQMDAVEKQFTTLGTVAVSYTHLDVYKRQAFWVFSPYSLCRLSCCTSLCRPLSCRNTALRMQPIICGSLERFFPVSYTHL